MAVGGDQDQVFPVTDQPTPYRFAVEETSNDLTCLRFRTGVDNDVVTWIPIRDHDVVLRLDDDESIIDRRQVEEFHEQRFFMNPEHTRGRVSGRQVLGLPEK